MMAIDIMLFLLMTILWNLVHNFVQFIKVLHPWFTLNSQKSIKSSDQGGEYLSHEFRDYLLSQGTIHQLSCLSAHQQNRLAERKHCHVIEIARSLMISTSVLPHFWAEAVQIVIYFINLQPSSILKGKSPWYSLFLSIPSYKHLKIFGCTCFVLLNPSEWNKLSSHSVRCVFLGFSFEHKGYWCYDHVSQRMYIFRDVIFHEHISYYQSINHSLTKSKQSASQLVFLDLLNLSSIPLTNPSNAPKPKPKNEFTNSQIQPTQPMGPQIRYPNTSSSSSPFCNANQDDVFVFDSTNQGSQIVPVVEGDIHCEKEELRQSSLMQL
jgi:hypothetical protein